MPNPSSAEHAPVTLSTASRLQGVVLAVCQLSLLLAGSLQAQQDATCGPFPPGDPTAELEACLEAGIQPSAASVSGAGDIVTLDARPAGPRRIAADGEALLALPKGPDGKLPTDYALGPGARIAGSFFSPVMCATVARVVGPPGSAPSDLVTRVPDTGALAPHHVYSTAADSVRPLGPDPYHELQYGLIQLDARRFWPISRGRGVTVALLDSAPQRDHADLPAGRLVALEEGPPVDGAIHGTLMAGIMAAREGNGLGIAGIAPNVDLVAIPICQPEAGTSDTCRLYDLLRALDLSWEAGARVINLSLVGPSNPILERAASRLEQLGVLLVAAAGNEQSTEPRYPAAYPSVIGVGAVDREGEIFEHSNRGLSVDVLAPGVEVLSTTLGGAFAFGDGTSLAAAHVSGVAALLLGAGTDPAAVRSAISGAGGDPRPLPPVCSLLARLGRECVP